MNTIATYEMSAYNDCIEESFDAALWSFQTYLGDPVAHIDRALAAQPDFVMGHLFRAIALTLTSERRWLRDAHASLEAAESRAGRANAREQQLTQAVRALVSGDWDAACRHFDQTLVDYPTDGLTLQVAHLMDFLRGDALNLRNRVARVLPRWSAAMPGYSFVLGMYAFGLEECNQYSQAEDTGRRALDMQPRDAWAVHAVTHVLEMQGRVSEGVDFLEQRREDWAPTRGPANGFAYHNWWHLALFHLDRGDTGRALEILDEQITPGIGDLSMGLVDVSSLLWRLKLLEVPLDGRFQQLADIWRGKQADEAGYYAFNDFHAALAFAGAGDREGLAAVKQAAERAAQVNEGSNRLMSEAVGLPLIAALEDYAAERYAPAATALEQVRDTAQRFGGSHAQRDLITLTLVDAARRAGQLALARHYLNERLSAKPASGLGWRLLSQVL